jgi:hypothetical protein
MFFKQGELLLYIDFQLDKIELKIKKREEACIILRFLLPSTGVPIFDHFMVE